MSSLIRQALLALYSFVVACPPSLCCQIDLISPRCALSQREMPGREQKAKPNCNHCCSSEPAKTEPAKPAKKLPTPAGPMPPCCCDRQPATPASAPWQLSILS